MVPDTSFKKIADDKLFKKIFEDLIEGAGDEAFFGGESKNKRGDKRIPRSQGRSLEDKIPVAGVIDRKTGTLIVQVVPDTTQKTLEAFIRDNVKEGSTIYTDGYNGYDRLYKGYEHKVSNHKKKQYKDTNSIESAGAPFKRSYNLHHGVSKKHLQRYVFQGTFRHNIREHNKEEKLKLLFSLVMGKKLTYESLIRG